MSGLLYYLPGINDKQAASKVVALAAELQLPIADLTPGQLSIGAVTNGPDERAGALFSPMAELPPCYGGCRMDLQSQEWRQASERVWIGWHREAPPTADGLRRPSQFGGWRYALGRDTWLIPILRRTDGTTELPRDMKLQPFREEVKPAYRELWDRSGEAFDWLVMEAVNQKDFDKEQALKFAVDVLGLNYRYGPLEQNAIGVIDSTNWLDVISCACDLTTLEALATAKKKVEELRAVLLNTEPGQAA